MEESGLKLVAEGAEQFLADLDKSAKGVESFGAGLEAAAGKTGGLEGGLSSLTGMLGGLGPVALGAGAVVAGALGAIGAAAFDFASQTSQATNDFQASLGVTREEAENLTEVVRGVFGNNFGSDIQDVTQAVLEVRTQMKGLAEEDIQGVTEAALALRDTFGVEVPESTNAAAVLMDKFGLSSQEAMDLVTTGFQKGLNTSGDFLESITEYGGLFATNGFEAEEFFSVLETGLQGGVLGTDKAADAFKEFGIRVQEGGETLDNALNLWGIDLNDFYNGLKDGSMSVADAYDLIIPKLREMDDPLVQNTIGVALFGTQWEDMGAEAMLAIDTAMSSMADMEGATASLNTKYENLGAVWETGTRQLLLALEPVGELMLDLANMAMPYVIKGFQLLKGAIEGTIAVGAAIVQMFQGNGQAAQDMGTRISELGGRMLAWIGEMVPQWLEGLGRLREQAIQWVADALPGLGTNLGKMAALLVTKIGEFIAVAGPKLIELAGRFVMWVATEALPKLPGELAKIASALITGIGNFLVEIGPPLLKVATAFVSWVVAEVIPKLPGELAKIGKAIMDGLAETGRNAASAALAVGRQAVEGIAQGIRNSASAILNALWDIAQEGLRRFKKALGIESPSRLFAREVGAPITLGIAEGILSETRSLQQALLEVGDDTSETARMIAEQITKAFQGGINLTTAFAGSLDPLIALRDQEFERVRELREAKESGDRTAISMAEGALADTRRRLREYQQGMITAEAIARQIQDPEVAAEYLEAQKRYLEQVADLEGRIQEYRAEGNNESAGLLQEQLNILRQRQAVELQALAQGYYGTARNPMSQQALQLLATLTGGGSTSYGPSYTYAPTYNGGGPPPAMDWAAARTLAGA